MKNKDLKKGKESIIGKIIYGFLLFMPLLAILSTILYTTFNKNAYKSYYADTINQEQTEYYNFENLKTYQDYNFWTYNLNLPNTINTISRSNEYFVFKILEENTTYPNLIVENEYVFGVLKLNNNNNVYYIISDTIGGTEIYSINTTSNIQYFNVELITYKHTIEYDYLQNNNILTSIKYIDKSFLSDSFYYAVDKVEQSNLFNWATNSIIYTGISNTCTQLSITNTFIPLLLAYWLIISVIYILYDIILMILIVLHNRIHRLQDSMS